MISKIKKIKYSLILCAVFVASLHVSAYEFKKSVTLSKLKSIYVSDLDTAGYTKVYSYPDENLNDLFEEKLDSLMFSWIVQNSYNIDTTALSQLPDSLRKALPDSVYINRLQALDSYVDLSFNETVKNFITLYTVKRRELVQVMLGLSDYYFPMFEEALDRYDLPQELKYMAIIESALNPRAFSRAGASGLWQFMYPTGRQYGLEVNSYIDERRDPVKATDAAARFLRDMYKIYGDWHLVIAAYNCGAGNVNKAIRRTGGKRNYWQIYYRLPRETRGYVPAYIAAAYFMNYTAEHSLFAREPEIPTYTDTLTINSYLHFNQVSEILKVPVKLIRDLNPQYRKDVIPARENKPYALCLPKEYISGFIDFEKQIFASNRDKYFPNNQIVKPSSGYSSYAHADVAGKSKVYYKVKSGDNVGYIASWFNVRTSDLRYWNNIRRNLIRVGQKLVLYVPANNANYYNDFNSLSFSQKQARVGKKPVSSTPSNVTTDKNFVYYTVRRGDTLWGISRQFQGVSNNDIMRLNNIRNAKSLHPGQKLKIKKKA